MSAAGLKSPVGLAGGDGEELRVGAERGPLHDAVAERGYGREVPAGQRRRYAAARLLRLDIEAEQRMLGRAAQKGGGQKVEVGAGSGEDDAELRDRLKPAEPHEPLADTPEFTGVDQARPFSADLAGQPVAQSLGRHIAARRDARGRRRPEVADPVLGRRRAAVLVEAGRRIEADARIAAVDEESLDGDKAGRGSAGFIRRLGACRVVERLRHR